MVQRGTLIAVFVGVEFALIVLMFQAINPHFAAVRDLPGLAGRIRDVPGSSGAASAAAAKYAFATGPQPTVTVDVAYADLTIVRHDTPGISVSIPSRGWHGFGSAAPSIAARQHGDAIEVTAQRSSSWTLSDDRMVTIEVPPGTRVTVANAGNIKATGLRAPASFNSNNGTVTIDDFDAPSLRVASSNGRLELRGVAAPRLEASTSNGRIEATALQVRNGQVESSNGKVSLGFARGSDSLVSATSSNGRVRVRGLTLAAGAAPSAGDDGDGDGSASKTVRIGAGVGRLDVRASNGNINLSQEG